MKLACSRMEEAQRVRELRCLLDACQRWNHSLRMNSQSRRLLEASSAGNDSNPLCAPLHDASALRLNGRWEMGLALLETGLWDVAGRARNLSAAQAFQIALLLLCLAGNLRSLRVFALHRKSKVPVYEHQVNIVRSDLNSVWIAVFYCLAEVLVDKSCVLQHKFVDYVSVAAVFSAILANRWILLASLLDRRKAMAQPTEYRAIDQVYRCKIISRVSWTVACLVSFVAAFNPDSVTLPPFQFHLRTSLEDVRKRVCYGGASVNGRGLSFTSRLARRVWSVEFAGNCEAKYREGLGGLRMPMRLLGAVGGALLGTDAGLVLAAARLLRSLRRFVSAKAPARRNNAAALREEKARAFEVRTTKTMVALLALVLCQNLAVLSSLGCWELLRLLPEPSSQRTFVRRKVCYGLLDPAAEYVSVVQVTGNFVFFTFLNPAFRKDFFAFR